MRAEIFHLSGVFSRLYWILKPGVFIFVSPYSPNEIKTQKRAFLGMLWWTRFLTPLLLCLGWQRRGGPGGAAGVPADESGLRGGAGDGAEAVRGQKPGASSDQQPPAHGAGELQGDPTGGRWKRRVLGTEKSCNACMQQSAGLLQPWLKRWMFVCISLHVANWPLSGLLPNGDFHICQLIISFMDPVCLQWMGFSGYLNTERPSQRIDSGLKRQLTTPPPPLSVCLEAMAVLCSDGSFWFHRFMRETDALPGNTCLCSVPG